MKFLHPVSHGTFLLTDIEAEDQGKKKTTTCKTSSYEAEEFIVILIVVSHAKLIVVSLR